MHARRSGLHQLHEETYPSSLLGKSFNYLWSSAIVQGYDVFAMLHADVAAQPGWLDDLVAILQERGADLVSAGVRLKDDSYQFSVGIDLDERGQELRRLSLDEIAKLPPVYSRADVMELLGLRQAGAMLVNTGCWIADLTKAWVRQVDFSIDTRIAWSDDRVRLQTTPEDWRLSRHLYRLGVEGVLGTRAIRTQHFGATWYDSHPPEATPEFLEELRKTRSVEADAKA